MTQVGVPQQDPKSDLGLSCYAPDWVPGLEEGVKPLLPMTRCFLSVKGAGDETQCF